MSKNSENNNYSFLVQGLKRIKKFKDTDLVKIGRKRTIDSKGYSEYYGTVKDLIETIKKPVEERYIEVEITNADVENTASSPKLVLDASTLNLKPNEIVVITKSRLEVEVKTAFTQQGSGLNISNSNSNHQFEGSIFGDSVASVPLDQLLISSGAPIRYYGNLPVDGNSIYFSSNADYVGPGFLEIGLLKVWYTIDTIG